MAESLNIPKGSKEEIYEVLIPQIKAIVDENVDIIANMSNLAACLKEAFDFWWVGFYRVMESGQKEKNLDDNNISENKLNDNNLRENCGKDELVLGPFQGPLACTRIKYGRGVCGTAWKEGKTIVVPDVDKFPGHIACSCASKSEIVVPLYKNKKVIAVLDIDSENLNTFDEVDKKYLEILVQTLI